MTHTSGRNHSGPSPNSAVTPSYPPTDISLRDILERWIGTDDSLRAALNAHSSFSNRRAEEERTRQEHYRFETRRVEFELLREAFRGGIHPTLIPQLFGQERQGGTQHLSPISPILRQEERSPYPTSSLPSYNRHDLPRINTSNLPPPSNRHYLVPQREKYAGPISAPPASMATTSPPPSIFFRHWAPPAPRTGEEMGLRTPREEKEIPSQRYHHHSDLQIPSPSSMRKSPPLLVNGISPKRLAQSSSTSHGRQRSEAPLATKLHESRHHPYSSSTRPLQHGKKYDGEEPSGLGATRSNLDREMVMRALREKVAPKKDDEKKEESEKPRDEKTRESEKKEVERRKVEQTRDVMGVEQLVESNGAGKD